MGKRLIHDDYWKEILKVLSEDALITWAGPRAWNEKLDALMIPDLPRPVLLWDNYFANDTGLEINASVSPYDGRSANLTERVQAVAIHSEVIPKWMLVPLYTAMDF